MHEAATAEVAVAAAVRAGFERISLDLIFGWPGQTLESWKRDLDVVLGWSDGAVKHLSLYSLIVEPGTPMADAVARGIVTVPDDDATADLYELGIARIAEAGWQHYEIANFAAGPEHQSVHNRVYWRNGEYLGIGAGAHGRVGAERAMRHLLPATYIRMIEAGEAAVSNMDVIDTVTAEGETMMLGLRLLEEGVSRNEFAARHGRTLDAAFGSIVAEQVELGLLVDDGDRVRVTERGMMVANDVVAAYLP
jgi:oxygen-independent coproporphyrinogen-3 oxidase